MTPVRQRAPERALLSTKRMTGWRDNEREVAMELLIILGLIWLAVV
jgi:hypothetical protein